MLNRKPYGKRRLPRKKKKSMNNTVDKRLHAASEVFLSLIELAKAYRQNALKSNKDYVKVDKFLSYFGNNPNPPLPVYYAEFNENSKVEIELTDRPIMEFVKIDTTKKPD